MKITKNFKFLKQIINVCYEKLKYPIKLEIHASDHCNLKCSGCSHYSPLANPKFCDLKMLEENLRKLSKFKNQIGLIHIIGGEPLLFHDLSEMIKIVRSYFDKTRIKIVTNGLLLLTPSKLPKDFFSTCRNNNIILKLTKYPLNVDYEKLIQNCVDNKIDLEVAYDRDHKSKDWSGWNEFLLNEKAGGWLQHKISFLRITKCQNDCLQLVGNRIYICNRAAYVNHLNKKFGTNFKESPKDYVEVDKLKSLRLLRKMLLFASPFCNYCPKRTKIIKWCPTHYKKEEWCSTGNK